MPNVAAAMSKQHLESWERALRMKCTTTKCGTWLAEQLNSRLQLKWPGIFCMLLPALCAIELALLLRMEEKLLHH